MKAFLNKMNKIGCMGKKILCCFTIMLFPLLMVAQQLNGKIVDRKKQPVPGATISSLRSGQHVHSNPKGEFSINDAAKGDTLKVKSLGFKLKKVVVENIDQDIVIQVEDEPFELDEFVVTQDIDAMNIITQIDVQTNPVRSSQEVLRKVPGLVIGQHAGGGKGEQIFLGGFDIDHGTDINITVDGMPVNMVSHAHGQGYADLHFLIPETIDNVRFGKGPYYADQGNFTTAGYVGFQTKDRLDNSSMRMEYGSFSTKRAVGMFNVLNEEKRSAYIASDLLLTDGPFESSQNFRRYNVLGKYTTRLDNDDKISLSFSKFFSEWDASGQIPGRLVNDGTISSFGAVDDTEGGNVGRTNLNATYVKKINNTSFVNNQVYLVNSDFELYSNFTFFLEDSLNGDQIRQKEKRQIVGASSEWNKFLPHDHVLKVGVGFRNDRIEDVELSHTKNRKQTLDVYQSGDVDETNIYSYFNMDIKLGKWTFNPALRLDVFNFKYNDEVKTLYRTQSVERGIFTPKLNVLYNQSDNLQFYLKNGTGFHSNDTRVVVVRGGKEVLPYAYGSDLGTIWKPTSKLLINTALWYLFLDQEFVYVGDAGIVEPSGRTLRYGIDFGLRYQAAKPLFLYADVNYANPRSIDEASGNDYIPLAPTFTASGGVSVVDYKNFNGGLQFRYITDRPANEDNSIVAEGYFITDVNVGYQWKSLNFGVVVKNLFDSEWKETQFATESRLKDETESVEEIHFTPGAPITIVGSISYKF